jgi:hypothetical protein
MGLVTNTPETIPNNVSGELPVTALLQIASSGSFDFFVACAPTALRMTNVQSGLERLKRQLQQSLLFHLKRRV